MALIRIGERPAPELRTLPEPIPQEESCALALCLLLPCWEAAIARKDQEVAGRALLGLAMADPDGALQKLEAGDVVTSLMAKQVKMFAAIALARSDLARAEALADTVVDSPNLRSLTLLALAQALPMLKRDRKLALLARAAVDAKAAKAPVIVARVAMALWKLGANQKAKALVAESVDMRRIAPRLRRDIGNCLARIDPPAALSIATELAATNREDANKILWNVAIGLAADNPAEAERVLRLVPQQKGQRWLNPGIAWKMATSDPRVPGGWLTNPSDLDDSPQTYLCLAYGLKARDPAGAGRSVLEMYAGNRSSAGRESQ